MSFVRLAFAIAALAAVFITTLAIVLNVRQANGPAADDCPQDDGSAAAVGSPLPPASPPAFLSPTPHITASQTAAQAATATVTPITSAASLQQRMGQAIASYQVSGRYAVAVTDLQSGETVSVNGDHKQLAGCAMNLFILLQVSIDMQEGRHATESIGLIDGLVSATTWGSNAETARDLYAIAGGGDIRAGVSRVDALMRELGLTDSVLDHPPLYAEFSLGRGDNWLTANEANEALVALWQGDLLTPAWRDYLLSRLATVKPGLNYLTGILASSGAVVSHKNGFFEYDEGFVDNDLGIVRFRRGEQEIAFAITFLSEGVPTKYADIALGQQLVQLAFAYFSAVYD
jgi:beta-lactamase class A